VGFDLIVRPVTDNRRKFLTSGAVSIT
jgi:hypothetical protein